MASVPWPAIRHSLFAAAPAGTLRNSSIAATSTLWKGKQGENAGHLESADGPFWGRGPRAAAPLCHPRRETEGHHSMRISPLKALSVALVGLRTSGLSAAAGTGVPPDKISF